MDIFGIISQPLGILMKWIYMLCNNYFVTIFLFTLVTRLILFPLNLKQQKSTMDRARLAPRLERLQKKYANDRQKLGQKQQELYERHGVSMTGGCLPMLLSMVVLLGVIGVIYAPISTLSEPAVAKEVITVTQYAMDTMDGGEETQKNAYQELYLMLNCEKDGVKDAVVTMLNEPTDEALSKAYNVDLVTVQKNREAYAATEPEKTYAYDFKTVKMNGRSGEEVYLQIETMADQFKIGENFSMLQTPWNDKGFGGINLLWIIPLISGATSFLVSFISMRFNKKSMPQNQPGQGCTNNMMMIYMPAISLFIAFSVPGAVGLYWIFSNLLSLVQTVVLNKLYDPGKARAEAEAEYQERRRRKKEDKERLAKARQREEAEARKAERELERQREESREMNKRKKKGGSAAHKPALKPSMNTHEEEQSGATDAVETTQPAENAEDASEE
ncbi:MAG: membrane protein insertase YidC [Clostridia bacterium]|nr:membrane protein insertase YidC [Clostridia bacterium]